MSTPLSEEVLNTIANIPWHELNHAYGVAEDAPEQLAKLFSNVEIDSSNAYYDWLLSAVFHQHTLYAATHGVVRVVISMLRTMDVPNLQISEERADKMLLDWIKVCAESSSRYPEVTREILAGMDVYKHLTQSENEEVKELTVALTQWCQNNVTSTPSHPLKRI